MADDPFTTLRLPGSPTGTPVQYLSLEDALNALGQQHSPREWGRLPGWSEMPYRWISDKRQYMRHELRLFGRQARLQRIPVSMNVTKAERQACIQLYRQVRDIIRGALESDKLHAYAMHHKTGQLSDIEAKAIWRVQTGPIFFTGRTVVRVPDQADQLAHVVIERKPCERWLADRAKAQAKTTTSKMLKDASVAIAKHRLQHQYEISRAEALTLVTEIARQHGKRVSSGQFKTLVWKPLGATAGRRTKAQQARYQQHEADLKALLNTVFGGVSGT